MHTVLAVLVGASGLTPPALRFFVAGTLTGCTTTFRERTPFVRKIYDQSMMKTKDKKSPLKEIPLRNPGQSLDEEIDDLREDKVIPYITYIMIFFVLALFDWVRWLTKTPITPMLLTFIFLVALVYFGLKLHKTWQKLNQLVLARDGEKIVGPRRL